MATKQEILAPLNAEQRDVAVNYHGKINLESIPGSGKTHTIVATVQYMIKDGVSPSRILCFTFTRKAANELRERVTKAVGTDASKVTICTYHSFCGRLLRGCAQYAGRSANFTVYDEDDKKKVLGKIVDEYFKGVGVEAMKYGLVANMISRLKMDNFSPMEAKIHRTRNSYEKAVAFIYEAYENKMRENNAFDFDDLPYFAYRIVKNNPEVLNAVASRYDYVISDENQDSNHTNLDFIMLLGSKSQNILMVGDTDQSIYAFRGADVSNVIDVVASQGFNTKHLSTNYRSTQTIVNAADSLIKHNTKRIDKNPGTINAEGEKIDVVYTDNCAKEAEYICRKIKIMMGKNPELDYKDFAVLCRTTNQINTLEEKFMRAHIPYVCKCRVPFYSRTEIKDILAYIKYALNPKDAVAFERIVNIPKRGIGPAALKSVITGFTKGEICGIIDLRKFAQLKTKKARDGFETFISVVTTIASKVSENIPPEELINYILEEIDYDSYLSDTVKEADTLDIKRINIRELVYLAATYDSVEEFLQDAVLDEPNPDSPEDINSSNKVNIGTLHGSKGLEFPVVILAGAHDESVPHIMCHSDNQQVEEERRLFYVGITRAESKLIITVPKVITGNMGIPRRVLPSRFISELPSKYLSKFQY